MILRPTVCTEGAAVCAHHTGFWQGRKDSNPRMLESKSSALTNLATPLHVVNFKSRHVVTALEKPLHTSQYKHTKGMSLPIEALYYLTFFS